MHIAHAFWLIKRQIIKRTVWGCIATYAKINRGEYGILLKWFTFNPKMDK